MFGFNSNPAPSATPTGKRDWGAILNVLGATMRDLGNPGGNALATTTGSMDAQRQRLIQQALMQKAAGLVGGGNRADPQGPSAQSMVQGIMAGDPNAPTAQQVAAPPPAMGLREAIPQLAQLQAQGLNVTPFLEMLKAQQPNLDFVNGMGVDKNDPANVGKRFGVNLSNVNGFQVDQQDPGNTGKFFPQLDKGQQPLFDQQGNVVAIRNMDGSVQAAAEMAGAVAGAQAAGQAPYDFISTPTPSGAPQVRSKATAAGGVFTGQSPVDAIREQGAAKAGVQAQTDLAGSLGKSQEALGVINQLRNHPGLTARTGMYGVLPAIPGTPGAGFDALKNQLQGKVFLEAYNTLKGGGQITEVEGKKAEQAMARLQTTQSPADFKAALDDLQAVIEAGSARAKAAAVGLTPQQAAEILAKRRSGR